MCRRRFVDWHPPSWYFRECGSTGAETAAIVSFLRDHKAPLYIIPPTRGVAKDGEDERAGEPEPLHCGPKKAHFSDWNAPDTARKKLFFIF